MAKRKVKPIVLVLPIDDWRRQQAHNRAVARIAGALALTAGDTTFTLAAMRARAVLMVDILRKMA